jgi:ribonuclease-3
MSNLSELERTLGITFADKSLLHRALIHRSYLNENPDLPLTDNERLEFLGDALLDFVSAEYLYQRFPEMQEGQMTSLRAALVREESLADFARALDLGQHLFLGHGEEASGGGERSPILCAAFESLAGAIFLDRGLDAARHFILRFIEPALGRILQERLDRDAKSLLQELSQGRWQLTPLYQTVAERGPDHAKEFTVEVLIGDQIYGRGVGRSKQAAEREAARAALEALETLPPENAPPSSSS